MGYKFKNGVSSSRARATSGALAIAEKAFDRTFAAEKATKPGTPERAKASKAFNKANTDLKRFGSKEDAYRRVAARATDESKKKASKKK